MHSENPMMILFSRLAVLLFFALSYVNSFRVYHRGPLLKRNALSLSNSPQNVQSCTFSGPGCVLLSKPEQLENLLMRSVVVITEHNDKGSAGQIVNKPTGWNMEEMAYETGEFKGNLLFKGGENGQDTAIMVHKYDLGGYSKLLGNGIYIGGSKQAREKVRTLETHPRDFKFIFNSIQWQPGVLKSEIENGDWDVCQVPVDMLIQQDEEWVDRLWLTLRTALNLPIIATK